MRRVDRKKIRAVVDGECSPEQAAEIRRALQADPRVAAELDQMMALRQRLRTLDDPPGGPPRFVPPPQPAPRAAWSSGWMIAAAAACALVAGLLWRMTPDAPSPENEIAPLAAVAPPPSVAALPPPSAAASPDGQTVRFVFAAPDAAKVQVAGDFTNWKPVALHRTGGGWSAEMTLTPGRHTYMYVVDGEWTTDPKANSFRDDEFGRRNAVLYL